MTTKTWIGIETRGTGIRSLQRYFELLGAELPKKLPANPKDWGDTPPYDAPHGILEVYGNGTWKVTFVLNSVMADIRGLAGVKTNFYKEGADSNVRTPLVL